MTVAELIKLLQSENPEDDVMRLAPGGLLSISMLEQTTVDGKVPFVFSGSDFQYRSVDKKERVVVLW